MSKHSISRMAPEKMRGLSLIELMISLTLGLFLIIGVGYAYLGSRTTSRQQDALSRIQEGARFAFETMGVDIRMAGFTGCMPGTITNNLPVASQAYWYGQPYDFSASGALANGLPLQGYENASASAPSGVAEGSISANVYTGGGVTPDALAVLRADNAQQYVTSADQTAAQKASGTFPLTSTPNIKVGDVIVATDCTNTLVSQVTAVAGNNVTAPGQVNTYLQNSTLLPLSGNVYYIRTNASGQPSLYRQHLSKDGAGNPTTAEELVEGVEDMQISYGVDTSACATVNQVPGDHVIDQYVTADNVAATVPCANNQQDWQRVLSVKVSLLLRSTDDHITTAFQKYQALDGVTDVTATDHRLRKVFTAVFAIRNRL